MGPEVPAIYVVGLIVGAYFTFVRGGTMFGSEAAALGVFALTWGMGEVVGILAFLYLHRNDLDG